ncbi:MAG: succinate dehydrogenase/fumarate reductase iron-sulfur subunit [Candidatus Brocadiae bacterium]|nr:succinate dehydrogenase/fumarate reductase iron-sulfur subunit [Candidatus Brocadiia bacterium]
MKNCNFKLLVWRQKGPQEPGKMVAYTVNDISPDMSFLEMMDLLNEDLIKKGEDPIAIDSDCREGICGTCGLVIQGLAHGSKQKTCTCQIYMRDFKDGETITVEPFRSSAFPIIKDLVVNRSALDRIISKGGYVANNIGGAPDANAMPISKETAELALDASSCIGCGACVAACPNSSAALFTGAKISQYAHLPQGSPDRKKRVLEMAQQMDKEGFGNCSNHGECEAVCPQGIKISHIAKMRREFFKASLL